ncbi:unnamed protein product [Prorocentrum cordatum]|uniref:Uncharacterized protein n=1 Tax=Prorocentrum cordatum TaxID=2364126 RepID=A0ABN9Y2Y9_9DINO|nr:unnamed protein product [Polarella glacialis]
MSKAVTKTSTAARVTVLTSLPVSLAWRSAGSRWAQDGMLAESSRIAPLLLGSLLLCVVLLFLLLAVHGRAEARKVCNKGYASAALPGVFSGLTFVLENFALANGLSATLVVLLNKRFCWASSGRFG